MLDLRTIPTVELKALMITCEALSEHNRYFEDLFLLLSKALLETHQSLELSEYKVNDLHQAVEFLKIAVDKNEHIPDDHPGKVFLKSALTAALVELERRVGMQGVH